MFVHQQFRISEMNPSSSESLESDKETTDLECLFDAFSSGCSLEEIGSAYCNADGDVNAAGEILYKLQSSRSNGGPHSFTGQMDCAQSGESFDNDKAYPILKNSRGSKPKKLTISTGTVSSVLGKGSNRSCQPQNGSSEATNPLKPELKDHDLSVDMIGSDFAPKSMPSSDRDVENFLFSMLHEGFNLDLDNIREVLRSCGYDVKKCMDQLLDISSLRLVKGKERTKEIKHSTDNDSEVKSHLPVENYPTVAAQGGMAKSNLLGEEKHDASREVLEALFTVRKRHEEEPKRTRLKIGLNRTRVVGQTVVSTLDGINNAPTNTEKSQDVKDVKDEEDKYKVLRRAVKQHWDLMKEYYEAAFDAFDKGDHDRANYLLERGKYYHEMAREANEKSAGEIMKKRSTDKTSVFNLDLHMHQVKEARSILKQHLHSLARMPTIRFLRVIVDSDAEDVKKGKRKLAVIQLLEKESISWTEEEGQTGAILIRLDLIDPEKLSFVQR